MTKVKEERNRIRMRERYRNSAEVRAKSKENHARFMQRIKEDEGLNRLYRLHMSEYNKKRYANNDAYREKQRAYSRQYYHEHVKPKKQTEQ